MAHFGTLLAMALVSAHQPDSARAWVRASIDAIGGEPALRAVRGLHLVGVHQIAGVSFSPHQTEPRMSYERINEWRDVEHHRSSSRSIFVAPNSPDSIASRTVVDADRHAGRIAADRFGSFPMDSAGVAVVADQFALAPERLLLTALAAPDLAAGRDTIIGSLRYHTIAFGRATTRVILNAMTRLPLAVETTRATTQPDWVAWGDIVDRTTFSSWSLQGNVRLPRTRTTTRNGMPYDVVSLHTLDVVDAIAADTFAIPDSLSKAPPLALQPVHQVTDGVVFIPGIWNVLLVRQPDGLVVIEAPYSPAYSRLVIAEAARQFPGVRIKAVVTTDFMWSHDAGVREYVARGATVFAAAPNVEMLRRIMASPHHLAPDSLARVPRPADIIGVTARTMVGTGPNRIELMSAIEPSTDYGERMIMAYLPERHLLYASDLLASPVFEPNFVSEGTADVEALVEREHLAVDSIIAIHIPPRAWPHDTVVVSVGSPLINWRMMRPYTSKFEAWQVTGKDSTRLFAGTNVVTHQDGQLIVDAGSSKMVFDLHTLAYHHDTTAFFGPTADILVEFLPRRLHVVYRARLRFDSATVQTHLYETVGREHGVWVVDDHDAATGKLASRLWLIDKPPYMLRITGYDAPKPGSSIHVRQTLADSTV